jgi:hypothetical protein
MILAVRNTALELTSYSTNLVGPDDFQVKIVWRPNLGL